jgi:opacity protein-like surface antigen
MTHSHNVIISYLLRNIMKHFLTTTALAAGLAFTASATTAADWNGAYAGGIFNSDTGHQVYVGGAEYDLLGEAYGGFVGYNVDAGSFVYGGEVSYSVGGAHEDCCDNYTFTQFVDLKGRVGYEVGDALVYGVAGWSLGIWDDGGNSTPTDGFNAGVGFDYMVADRFFVGAEYA